MDLDIRSCQPFAKHLKPGVSFEVELDFSSGSHGFDRVPIEVGGRLEANDGKVLGHLHEWTNATGPDPDPKRLSAGKSGNSIRDQEYLTTLYSPLGEEGIDYLDQRREVNERGDVILDVIVEAQVLESKSQISSLHRVPFEDTEVEEPEQIENKTKTGLITYGYDTEIQPGHTDLWVLSGDSGADFLGVGRQVSSVTNYRIPAMDWTHGFLPELGFGRSLTVDIPDPAEFHDEHIGEGLAAAFEELESAKRELRRGEWRVVTQHLLGVYDAISEEELWELEEAGYTSEAEGCLNGLRSNFNDYLGKFRHRRGRDDDIQAKAEPHREDVYFMYVMMAGIVQLLAKKHSIRHKE